jgi:hypothetical protein
MRIAKKGKTQIARGRKQDRARVAGGQDYEARYEAKKNPASRHPPLRRPFKGRQPQEAGRKDVEGRER